jgi:hypothetical protein
LSTEEAVKRKWIGMLKITCGREVTEVRTEGGPGGEGREPEINLSRVPTFSPSRWRCSQKSERGEDETCGRSNLGGICQEVVGIQESDAICERG